jgi:uncharacterized repeat protein (TIGR01451 family)
MKKTSTRLATIAAVLTMSAFAIVLAQHDARKRDRHEEPLTLAVGASEPAEPLRSDLVWPGKNPLATGDQSHLGHASENQDSYTVQQPELPAEDYAAMANALREEIPGDLQGAILDPADSTAQLPETPEFGASHPENPSTLVSENSIASLGDGGPTWDSATSAQSLRVEATDVVAASGEQPALPAWLPDGGTPPPLPASSLPGSSLPASSLPAPVAPSATLSNPLPITGQPGINPSTPNLPAVEQSLQNPSLPQPWSTPSSASPQASAPPNALPGRLPAAPAATNSMVSPYGTPDSKSFDSVARTALVSNQPGNRSLDGSQNPIMLIHKSAPEEVQVGKKATMVITVRNAGNATAHEVTVVDRVPQGAQFADASPTTNPTADGVLTWLLGEMAAGDEKTISLQIIPQVEGEVGSVASVHFAAQASVRTVATLPQLMLQVESVGPVIIGQNQQLAVTLQNTGSGVARNVRLEADIPAQLRHESGETQLEAYVGDLRPSESRRLTLGVAAIQPGQSQCLLRAVNDDGVQAERALDVDVRAPQLAAKITGPSLRYLERQANYQVVVTNSGTAIARNLDFVVHLPVGLKFISVDIPQANYNPQTHSISLGLAELDSAQSAPFTITVLPVQPGAQVIRFNGTGDLGVVAEAKAQVTVAGLAELAFTIGQDNGTVELGANTTYSVQVSNVGNQPDKNVQLVVQLPEGTQLLQVDAPVEYRVEGGKIAFAPVAEMRNRDVKTFRFQVQHNRAGNQVVRSQLTSENWPVAVVKEEGTLVYNDQN